MSNEGRMGMKILSSMQLAVSRKIGEGCDERRMGTGKWVMGMKIVSCMRWAVGREDWGV